ncbi:MAG: hypothetical protein AAF432_02740 [Planctomycetota bacterium]
MSDHQRLVNSCAYALLAGVAIGSFILPKDMLAAQSVHAAPMPDGQTFLLEDDPVFTESTDVTEPVIESPLPTSRSAPTPHSLPN